MNELWDNPEDAAYDAWQELCPLRAMMEPEPNRP